MPCPYFLPQKRWHAPTEPFFKARVRLELRYLDAEDGGGSNGCRQHRFKEQLCYLASELRCDIQVAHYPPGCSKYNPIEHRLFCHVSRAIQAVVLKTIQVAKDFIGRTHTAHGLHVVAEIARSLYQKGIKASPAFFDDNPIRFDTQGNRTSKLLI